MEMDCCVCLCFGWPSLFTLHCACVWVLGEMKSDVLTTTPKRSNIFQSAAKFSVEHGVSELHVACRQCTVSRLIPVVSAVVMFPSK